MKTTSSSNIFAVVMAGGSGERFWPMGRRSRPKQFLPLGGGDSLLAESVARFRGSVPVENILVVTNRNYAGETRRILDIPPENVIAEPEKRDTAPCVALAAGIVSRRAGGGDPTMIVVPADPIIADGAGYRRTLATAVAAAADGALVTIGVAPTEPATGFGYIECGETLRPGVRRSLRFREKPDAATAAAFVAAGNYLWNSGVFVWKLSALLSELRLRQPELADFAAGVADAGDWEATVAARFSSCRKISIDYALMEGARNVLVVDAGFDWDDAGSWSALRRRIAADRGGNTRRGRFAVLDCADSILVNDDPGHLIGVIGLKEVAVIRSGNATLLCPLAEAQRVKELLRRIAEEPDGEKFL